MGAIPRQQFRYPVDRKISDALQHLAQVGFRVDAIEFGGLEQRVDRSRALAAVVRSGEEPVLAVM